MKKHKINCQQCGQEFESLRSDAKYCSNSCKTRASQIKSKENPVIKIIFDQGEFEELAETAEEFGLSVEELVKYRSMLTTGKIHQSNKLYKEMEIELKKNKAELSLHTNIPSEGIFLDMDAEIKQKLVDAIEASPTLSELHGDIPFKIIMAGINHHQLEKSRDDIHNKILEMTNLRKP